MCNVKVKAYIEKKKFFFTYTPTKDTRNNLSIWARNGVKVKVFYCSKNNIVNIFTTIADATKYYDIDHNTMSKHIKLGSFINNHRFEAELKDVRVLIYDIQYNIVDILSTANKTAKFCATSHTACSSLY